MSAQTISPGKSKLGSPERSLLPPGPDPYLAFKPQQIKRVGSALHVTRFNNGASGNIQRGKYISAQHYVPRAGVTDNGWSQASRL